MRPVHLIDVISYLVPEPQVVIDDGNITWLDERPQPTQKEIDAAWPVVQQNKLQEHVRQQRNIKLAACDWVALTDVTASQEWIAYRQALRDVPQQNGFPKNVVWPEEPK